MHLYTPLHASCCYTTKVHVSEPFLNNCFSFFLPAHSPDNTFLGFVVENHISPAEDLKKKNIALVYGKHINMWQVNML